MIAIIDGGSTKCDWVFISESGQETSRTKSTGFNPNIIKEEEIVNEISKDLNLKKYFQEVNRIYFYGSGCGNQKNCLIVERAFSKCFPNAKIRVKEDLTAAAYAAYNGKPSLVCILGTGSNCCGFDGTNLQINLPSLGYIIGDEGGGCGLGKRLLKAYFMKKLPSDLHQRFVAKHDLDIQTALQNMFHNPHTNAFFASFNTFIYENIQHPFLNKLVYDELSEFFDYQILPQLNDHAIEVNFVGSIATLYEDILRTVACKFHVKIGKIVQKPIDDLVQYHIKYLLNQ